MSKLFYDHLVLTHELHSEVEMLDVEKKYKVEIVEVIEETIHHEVLHLILNELDEKHHAYFLEIYHQKPHDPSLMEFLKSNVIGIEEKLKNLWAGTKYKLLKEIRSQI